MGHSSIKRLKRFENTKDWLEEQLECHPDRFEQLKKLSYFCQGQEKNSLKYPLYEAILFFYRIGENRQNSDSRVAQTLNTTCERIHTARKIGLYFLANLAGSNRWQFHQSIIARHDRIVQAYNQNKKRREEMEEKQVQIIPDQIAFIATAPTQEGMATIKVRINRFTKQIWEAVYLLTEPDHDGRAFIEGSYLPIMTKAMEEVKKQYPGFVWDSDLCYGVATNLLKRGILERDGDRCQPRGYLVRNPESFQILEAPISKAAAKRLGIFGSTAVEPIEAIKIVINQQIEEEKHLQQEAVKIQARLIYLANRREKLKNGLAKLLEQL